MRTIVTIITLLMALSLASIVAYVSVTGLMKLFAGAGIIGMAFFILIETSKIISTTLLHTFRDKIKGILRLGLNVFIGVTMMITSLGIYGFLSSTYKESFLKSENTVAEIELLQKKVDGYQEQLTFITTEKTTVNETIGELSKGLSNNVIQYKDKETGEIITTTSSSTRRALEKQLDKAIERQGVLNGKSDSLNVIVFDVENEILEVKLSDDTATELGPLIFLSDVTGLSMDNVMKWFILLLIIIGDPLAVTMVIAFNKVIHKKKKKEVEGLPMDSLIGDVVSDSPHIVKTSIPEGKEFNVEYPLPPLEEKTDDSPDVLRQPLSGVEVDLREDLIDEDHALDMAMNDVVEDLIYESDLGDYDKIMLEEWKKINEETTIEDNKEDMVEELVEEIENNSIDEQLEIDKSKVIDLPKETQIEVIENPVVKEERQEIPPRVENKIIDNKPPKKRMGIDRIR